MKPRFDIDKKLSEKKSDILEQLLKEIRLPVTDVANFSFDKVSSKDQFKVTIDQDRIQRLDFDFKVNTFIWDIRTIYPELESHWNPVLTKH